MTTVCGIILIHTGITNSHAQMYLIKKKQYSGKIEKKMNYVTYIGIKLKKLLQCNQCTF